MDSKTKKMAIILTAMGTLISGIVALVNQQDFRSAIGLSKEKIAEAQAPQLPETIGSCTIDKAQEELLKRMGIYGNIKLICKNDGATTVEAAFHFPIFHDDSNINIFIPKDFFSDHPDIDNPEIRNILMKNIDSVVSKCYNQSKSNKKISPHEKINREITCLQKNGYKVQDWVYWKITKINPQENGDVKG